MSSREKILQEVKANKPAAQPLPTRFFVEREEDDLVARFTAVLQSIGGAVLQTNGFAGMEGLLLQKKQSGVEVVNGIPALPFYNLSEYAKKSRNELETVHTFFLQGELAVAENGAVWLSEENMGKRILPFICKELILVVDEENLVADMHQAYERFRVNKDGYGVFIAGPSKTADIEQSLVIGAHGPLSLQVLLLKK